MYNKNDKEKYEQLINESPIFLWIKKRKDSFYERTYENDRASV